MTRFVVEEGGKRRAFKVGNGVITVGSGPQATLRLSSASVAELHAELEVLDGVVKLRPKPGVVPPKLAGRPATAETVVPKNTPLSIGDAKILVDPPEAGAPAESQKPKEKQAWERSSRELYKDKGLKPAHMLMILGPIAVIVFFIVRANIGNAPAPTLAADAQIIRARENVKAAVYDQAEQDLRLIPEPEKLSDLQRGEIEKLKQQIAEGRKAGDLAARNDAGSDFLQTQLINFEQQRLSSKIEKPVVRVFMKRLAEFERRWPDHPEMEWVRRKKERYSDMVDLSKPATFPELKFEIESLTWAQPRNYKEAFAVLNRWLESAKGDERAEGLALFDKLTSDREAWCEDRLLQAAHEFKKGNLGQSVEWLAVLMVYSGDEQMAQRAGSELVKFDGLDLGADKGIIDLRDRMRGYRRVSPHYWEAFVRVPAFKAWLDAHPLD
ncbi:MAG: hypothetical protein IT454_19455 [Planctomycetes bacterium]|nr:hypothetical protein [Planctomycetota bacterium]